MTDNRTIPALAWLRFRLLAFADAFEHWVLQGIEHRSAYHRRAVVTLAAIFITAFLVGKIIVLRLLSMRMGAPELALINVLLSCGSLLGVWLARRHLVSGELVILVSSFVMYALAAYWFGAAGGFQYYSVFVVFGIFLAVGYRAIWRILIYLVLAVILVLTCQHFFQAPAQFTNLPPELLQSFTRSNIVVGAIVCTLFAVLVQRRAERAEAALAREFERSEGLVRSLLPAEIADRLKDRPGEVIADQGEASILFADIVDFSPRAARMGPGELIGFLNAVFSTFDRLTEQHGLEKVKTIGDAYMVVAGLPNPRTDHPQAIADLALDLQAGAEQLSAKLGQPVALRIGLHCGPVVAGVIGSKKLFFDVWGDTVNAAARLESQGLGGRIQMSQSFAERLGDGYASQLRGRQQLKGLGEVTTFWLTGKGPLVHKQDVASTD